MKKHLRFVGVSFLTGLFIILVYLVVSSFTGTETTSFIATWIVSSVIVTRITYKNPDSKWYLAPLIYIPLLSFLIIIYKGEYLFFYLKNIFFCLIITYTGALIGVWLSSQSRKGLSKSVKTGLFTVPLLLLVFLLAYTKNESSKLDRSLVAVLDTVFRDDQKYRIKNIQVSGQNIDDKDITREMNRTDSINLIKINNIIDKYGWPGEDIAGRQGNSTIWAVIQHSSPEVQKKYLPIMRDAVKKGDARPSQLALLEDRYLTSQGKEQVYGSQIRSDSLGKKEFYPIHDEGNVNRRRLSVGLGPLQWYAKSFGFKYRTPELKGK
jgi:hypothetical protein